MITGMSLTTSFPSGECRVGACVDVCLARAARGLIRPPQVCREDGQQAHPTMSRMSHADVITEKRNAANIGDVHYGGMTQAFRDVGSLDPGDRGRLGTQSTCTTPPLHADCIVHSIDALQLRRLVRPTACGRLTISHAEKSTRNASEERFILSATLPQVGHLALPVARSGGFAFARLPILCVRPGGALALN